MAKIESYTDGIVNTLLSRLGIIFFHWESKDQTFLLILMETGIVSETKYRKTRTIANVKTWVFATKSSVIPNVVIPSSKSFVQIF